MATSDHTPGTKARPVLPMVVGAVGEVMLTLGLLLGLFIVWELWWTDITGTHRQQEIVDNLDWEVSAIIRPEAPPEDVTYYAILQTGEMEREKTPPAEQVPAEADTFATIYVPRWGLDYVRPISEGTSRRQVLDVLGIGHYPDTAMPGGWGNFAVAGHRTTYGKPFADIEELEIGDAIVIRTDATWYVYRVAATAIVKPSFAAAVAPVPGQAGAAADGRYITLTTCHPPLSARERYVVYGELEYWALAASGYPPELFEEVADPVDDGESLPDGGE